MLFHTPIPVRHKFQCFQVFSGSRILRAGAAQGGLECGRQGWQVASLLEGSTAF